MVWNGIAWNNFLEIPDPPSHIDTEPLTEHTEYDVYNKDAFFAILKEMRLRTSIDICSHHHFILSCVYR